MFAQGRRRIPHDLIVRFPPLFQRQIEARKIQRHAQYMRIEHAQRFFQQFLPGLIPFQYHNRSFRHESSP